MPKNFLIKLNLWWDYSLFHDQRKKCTAIRKSKAKKREVRWGEEALCFPPRSPSPDHRLLIFA